MPDRAILVSDGSVWEVAREDVIEKELHLQDAVAAHPEVLPAADIGLEPLATLGTEVVAAPDSIIDMVAADRLGRLAIVEFKKGPENPDVRKVVAQLLDYGSALWQMSLEDLARRCDLTDLASHVGDAYGEGVFDPEVFLSGVEETLSSGRFVYFYVARVLDNRTRRVLTYLGDGVRLPFIAVEADHFVAGQTRVLAPHPAFVPSWMIIAGNGGGGTQERSKASDLLPAASPAMQELVARADVLAEQRGWHRDEKASFIYSLDGGQPRLYIYPTFESVGFNPLRYAAQTTVEDSAELQRRLEEFVGHQLGKVEPGLSNPQRILDRWDLVRDTILIPYVERQRIAT